MKVNSGADSGVDSDPSMISYDSGDGIRPNVFKPQHPLTKPMLAALSGRETGGEKDPYSAPNREGSGAKGKYQFMPDTWSGLSREYTKEVGMDPTVLPMTPANQELIAAWDVDRKLRSGWSPEQVANYWYTGKPDTTLTKGKMSGTGIPYGVGDYRSGVMENFNRELGLMGSGNTNTPTNAPGVGVSPDDQLPMFTPDKSKSLAYQYGQAMAQGQLLEMKKAKYAEGMKYLDAVFKNVVDSGDNEAFQGLLAGLGNIPGFPPQLLNLMSSVNVTGGGEYTATVQMNENFANLLLPKAADPVMYNQIKEMAQSGTAAEIKIKKGKVVGIKPAETPPKTEFDTFARGRRDELRQEGWTDEAQINRVVAQEWKEGKGPKAIENDNRYIEIMKKADLGEVLTAEEQSWARGYERLKMLQPEARGEAYGKFKMQNMLDGGNGYQPVTVSAYDIERENAAAMAEGREPRYLPAEATTKAMNRTALIEDIRGAIDETEKSLSSLKRGLTPKLRAKLIYIASLTENVEVQSAWRELMGSEIANTLKPEEVRYLTNLRQLHENAMAMRSVLGAGQGSLDLRNAIRATIPSAITPNVNFAREQLRQFRMQLERLARGVPKVGLRELPSDYGQTPGQGQGGNQQPQPSAGAPPAQPTSPAPAPQPGPASKPTTKPPFAQWLEKARTANPGVDDEKLTTYYRNTYGEPQ